MSPDIDSDLVLTVERPVSLARVERARPDRLKVIDGDVGNAAGLTILLSVQSGEAGAVVLAMNGYGCADRLSGDEFFVDLATRLSRDEAEAMHRWLSFALAQSTVGVPANDNDPPDGTADG